MADFQGRGGWRRLVYSRLTLGLLILAVLILGRSVWRIFLRAREVATERVKLERELKSLTERRVILESDIAKLTTPGGVEEEIRKKFPVVQAGERVIVVVPEELGSTSAASSTGGWPQWLAGLIKWR